jgi:ATP-binding cassette subfamily F protein 3
MISINHTQYLELRHEIRENNWRHKKKAKIEDRKINRKFRAKASKASMAQSMIKKLDKIDRIEVDEDDNSVMNIVSTFKSSGYRSRSCH